MFAPIKRLMVPRWRSLRKTIASKELASSTNAPNRSQGVIAPELRRALEKWRAVPGLISAAEAVEAVLAHGAEHEGVSAARALLQKDSAATDHIQKHAAVVLRRAGRETEIPAYIQRERASEPADWRRRTRLHPNDALAWVELALHQTIRGSIDHAKRSITVALQLAPNNRHVLRSAARFFLHDNDPERAHDILLRSPATPRDPWLSASEIALSTLADRNPRFFKSGLSIVENDQLFPRQITELAGSVATTLLSDGNVKRARKLFQHSLRDPNGNSLAQAEWATPQFSSELISVGQLASVDEPFEAQALHLTREGKFQDVPHACAEWSEIEPYSIRPHEVAASAASILGNFDEADEWARKGLTLRRNSPALLNSRAFALASSGKMDEAVRALNAIPGNAPEWIHAWALANKGLIAFRAGEYADGKEMYRTAASMFLRAQQPESALSAQVYLAREMARARLPEATKFLAEVRNRVENTKSASLKSVLHLAELYITTSKLRQPT